MKLLTLKSTHFYWISFMIKALGKGELQRWMRCRMCLEELPVWQDREDMHGQGHGEWQEEMSGVCVGDVTFSHRAPESLHWEVLLGAGLERWRDSKWRIGLDHDAGAEPEMWMRKGRQPWCLCVCVWCGCCSVKLRESVPSLSTRVRRSELSVMKII